MTTRCRGSWHKGPKRVKEKKESNSFVGITTGNPLPFLSQSRDLPDDECDFQSH